jgi:hypothetical protein
MPKPVPKVEAPKALTDQKASAFSEAKTIGTSQRFAKFAETFDKRVKWNCTTGTKQTYKVIQAKDVDWNKVRTKGPIELRGKTNLEAAKAGYAPELANGSVMNLHHLGQKATGPLVELPPSLHTSDLHKKFGYKSKNPKFPVDRSKFDLERPKYWKDRAMEVENGK